MKRLVAVLGVVMEYYHGGIEGKGDDTVDM